ncbi:hypothetical protein ACFWIA_23745 [Streptomyces sp. NPDC127068]|uniref:hypothetical protein n=1 Tax=Streptomyces sp. NPDC127068 TaxID=3347127 RepID=UPI00364EB63A
MGIESDQLVFDYLSRVGDLAQQHQLPSSARMRLVADLRDEIDRRRAKVPADSPASVRRILSRIGEPGELVARAGSGDRSGPGAEGTPTALPEQRTSGAAAAAGPSRSGPDDQGRAAAAPDDRSFKNWLSKGRPSKGRPSEGRPSEDQLTKDQSTKGQAPEGQAPEGRAAKGLWRLVPRPRPAGPTPPADDPRPAADEPAGPGSAHRAPSPPHLAPLDELGTPGGPRDWWRVESSSPFETVDRVPGFVGGIEIPDILKPPPGPDTEDDDADDAGDPTVEKAPAQPAGADPAPGTTARGGRVLALLTGWSNPLLLVAAALLVVGALAGNLLALGGGWALAWLSKRLTPAESKFAVLWIPGLSLAGGVTWLWGRAAGHWGPELVEERFDQAIGDAWPWVLKSAAFASAVFLVWRSQRRS